MKLIVSWLDGKETNMNENQSFLVTADNKVIMAATRFELRIT